MSVEVQTEIYAGDVGAAPTESIPLAPPSGSDRYDLRKKVGSGSFGAVYKAWDRQDKRWVAVKLMDPKKAVDAQNEVRLLQAAQKDCEKNHVVCYVDAYSPARAPPSDSRRGKDYIAVVTEFVEGQPLDEVDTPTGKQIAEWTVQLFRAIKYLHSLGIMHRDVKPDNIMVRPDGRIVLVDLGIGCSPCPTKFWGVEGTPMYMWPPLLQTMTTAQKTSKPVGVSQDVLRAADYYGAAVSMAAMAVSDKLGWSKMNGPRLYRTLMEMPLVPRRPKLDTFLRTILEEPWMGEQAK